MLFHNEIRQEFVDLIHTNIPELANLHNGKVFFKDVKNELPAVAVFIDNAECEIIALPETQQWEAELEIAIYTPFHQAEKELDVIAERINQAILEKKQTGGFNTIERLNIIRYSYDYDENGVWNSAVMTFQIYYKREVIYPY